MTYTSPVTQKGQITISKVLRTRFNINPRQRVKLVPQKGYIEIHSIPDFFDMVGIVKPQKNKSVLRARDAFEKSFRP